MIRKVILLAAICLCNYSIFSQKIGDRFVPAYETIEEGIKLHEDEKYEDAIKMYSSVNSCDSIYYLALYEKALTYTAMKQYDKAIESCKKGLTLNSTEERGFYDLLASAYDYKEMTDSAFYYYDQGLKKFPHYHKYYFEKAVSCVGRKIDSTAYRYLIQSARLNPIHPGTHLQLARLAARNGHFTAAILAYQYYLIVEPDGNKLFAGLKELEKLCNNNVEQNASQFKFKSSEENDFAELDEIIKSRAAQIASYKSKVKLPYNDVIKQCQITSEKFKYNSSDKGFYNQFYGNMWSQAWKKGYFETSMYSIFASVDAAETQNQVKKNAASIKEFQSFMFNLTDDFRKAIKHRINGNEVEGERYFYNKGTLAAVGKMENSKKTGKWYIYNSKGYISNEGFYQNDQLNGMWVAFYDSGKKLNEVNWVNGKRMGEYKVYYENGILKEKGSYNNDLIDGESISYFSNGAMKDKSLYKNGVLTGEYILYDKQGNKSATAFYDNGKISGKVINYYSDGKVYDEREFLNGLVNGPTKGYYSTGEVYYTGNYKNGKREGTWTWFYTNGKKLKEGSYKADKEDKTWIDYFENGATKEIMNFDNGETDGEFKSYTRLGVVFNEGKYKGNKLVSSVNYDEDKKLINEFKNSSSSYALKTFYKNGNVEEEGEIKDKIRNGKYTSYYLNGTKGSEIFYKNGEFDGILTRYYYNGKIKEEENYVNGQQNGYFKEYYENGKLKQEGYYNKGKLVGPRTEYYLNGKVRQKLYYSNGEAIGHAEYFDVKGKMDEISYFDDVYSYRKEYLDTTGKVYQSMDMKLNDLCVRNYFNKQKWEEFTQTHGVRHGKSTEYYPSGKVRKESNYFNGELEGISKLFDVDGKLISQFNYKNGSLHGKQEWFGKNGKVEYSEEYKTGKLEGKRRWYFDDGKIQCERNFSDNQPDSISDYFGEDGTLAMRLLFDEGVLVAHTHLDKNNKLLPYTKIKNETANIVSYYPNGKKAREINYVNGEVQGKRMQYYTNGNTYIEANFVDDEYSGKSTEYYLNGKVKSEVNYVDGEREGLSKTFYDNGMPETETEYICDVKYGTEKRYDKSGKLISVLTYINGYPFEK